MRPCENRAGLNALHIEADINLNLFPPSRIRSFSSIHLARFTVTLLRSFYDSYMPPVARSVSSTPHSRPSVMVGIIIGCIVGLYFVAVMSYYLYCSIIGTFFVREVKERTVPYSEVRHLSAAKSTQI